MYLLGVHTGHDAAACVFNNNSLIAYVKEGRLTRNKNDGCRFDIMAVEAVLDIAGISADEVDVAVMTRMQLPLACYRWGKLDKSNLRRKLLGYQRDVKLSSLMTKKGTVEAEHFVDSSKLKQRLGLKPDAELVFANHHRSHVMSSFGFVDWPENFLMISCDGGGDCAQYSAWLYDGTHIQELFGGEETMIRQPQNPAASIGLAYTYATERCGFRRNRHEGKITGLAAFGKPLVAQQIIDLFQFNERGEVLSRLEGLQALENRLEALFHGLEREDVAASIQLAAETVIGRWVHQLVDSTSARYIAMSGGVFSNVKLNQIVAELPGVEEVFIFPAMGDEGLPVGGCIDYLVAMDGADAFKRCRLSDVYLGKPYAAGQLVRQARERGFDVVERNVAEEAAKRLASHQVGAIYNGRMEMGPRALGARTILASPSDKGVNASINERLQRTEFMPFAPYVCEEDAAEVFEINDINRYACRFMTITTHVKDKWKTKIPAVVHVDGTARPQIVTRKTNALYYDILQNFKKLTGLPVLVNTSFNAHEEPIINTPEEAIVALEGNRIDFIVCQDGVIS